MFYNKQGNFFQKIIWLSVIVSDVSRLLITVPVYLLLRIIVVSTDNDDAELDELEERDDDSVDICLRCLSVNKVITSF